MGQTNNWASVFSEVEIMYANGTKTNREKKARRR
jgi:hypothetical protein